MLRAATAKALPALQILGAVPRAAGLDLPSRHLGLVLAEEHAALESFVERAADVMADTIDLDALVALAEHSPLAEAPRIAAIPPLGQRIALARDRAFAFAYPHLLESWRRDGVELLPFSPLADEPPPAGADAVFLPGGYPELYAGQLAAAARLKAGLRQAAARQLPIYGECGGYMMLGEALIDGDGVGREMAGLLPVTTSFAKPRRRLGYRQVTALAGPWQGTGFRAHEFHFAEEIAGGAGTALFACRDADGMALAETGTVRGSVAGSFIHLIDRLADPRPYR
jgi:cobyrinic acid a,c-diamide synthase